MEDMDQALRDRIQAVTEKVIGCAYTVQNTLGVGFVEAVYENALAHEVRKSGLTVEQQKRFQVTYDGLVVGEYLPDLMVDDCVLVELKAVKAFDDVHTAQCLNYLKATGRKMCVLLNFGSPRVEYKRIVLNL
jgi:GxxExxY protein